MSLSNNGRKEGRDLQTWHTRGMRNHITCGYYTQFFWDEYQLELAILDPLPNGLLTGTWQTKKAGRLGYMHTIINCPKWLKVSTIFHDAPRGMMMMSNYSNWSASVWYGIGHQCIFLVICSGEASILLIPDPHPSIWAYLSQFCVNKYVLFSNSQYIGI